MVGRHYGSQGSIKLIGKRSPNHFQFVTITKPEAPEQLEWTTDKGVFIGEPEFTGADYFTIIGALWIDAEHQTVRKAGNKFPIIVQPGTEVSI